MEYRFKHWKLYDYNKDKLTVFFADDSLTKQDYQDLPIAVTVTGKKKKSRETYSVSRDF